MFASPTALLRNALRILVPVAVALTVYTYLYPVFGQCAFPLPPRPTTEYSDTDSASSAFRKTLGLHLPSRLDGLLPGRSGLASRPLAPFRMLALGDPQLEGDTSIPNAYSDQSFPNLVHAFKLATFQKIPSDYGEENGPDDDSVSSMTLRERMRQTLHDLVDFWFLDIPNTILSGRKRIDLFGNDFYLAHIVRLMRWWTVPTHISVLGDLLGSQWVDDDEFERRAFRFWNRVLKNGERIPDELAMFPADEYDLSGYLGMPANTSTPINQTVADIAASWTRRIINVAGNHDIGYAGDITAERLARFERQFGKANYELRFELPVDRLSADARTAVFDDETNPDSHLLVPELRIINLNDMNLDTPAYSADIQDQTYNFINAIINTASAVEFKGHFTIVLTHIPLYKPEGVCVDAPYFAFHDDDGTLREQNLLSEDASEGFLQGIFGMHGDRNAPGGGQGRRGVILNGHDHEGCDTFHYINQSHKIPNEDRRWETATWATARTEGLLGKERDGLPGVREITVRSMMGEFGGNAGLLSAWFDEDAWEWRFEYATCAFGRQHVWWVVHIVDLVAAGLLLVFYAVRTYESLAGKPLAWPSCANIQKKELPKDKSKPAKAAMASAEKGLKPVSNGTPNR
ncbi:hypothetical protein SPBR_02561 [Sporothrix brasiliensis 5110]|uniref:Polarized growth protein n=1 Tax=Sporothrix brasiliensis 5110 TaxID=1398154 RepID=A0A0C2J8D3_9PEZI|nr:uncharacterized protein SPBR_02561 [Sporothrix brasiliensis 5110]KIH93257.1 hypothetical protein SPBR_02561 [Sporothrix brasiliensis 5110]